MAAAAPDTWMPLWIGPYLANTLHLTRAQHGSYCLLIMACWKAGGSLPANDSVLATIAKCTPREWRAERDVFAAFFDIDAGMWTHPRVVAELNKAREFKDKQTRNGGKGGRPPKPKKTQTQTQPETQTKPKPKPKETTSPLPNGTVTTTESLASSERENPDGSQGADWVPEAGAYDGGPVARAQPIPRDWQPTADDIEWAEKVRPDIQPARLKLETEGFKNHALANRRTFHEVGPAWRNWVMKAQLGGVGPAPRSSTSHVGEKPDYLEAFAQGASTAKQPTKGILDT